MKTLPFARLILCASITGTCTLISTQSHAAAFALIEHSSKGIGTSFAGGSASADDPSTVFFNPAGITRLQGTQFSAGLSVILPDIKFKDQASTSAVGTSLSGGDGGNGGENAYVPILYYVRDINDKFKFGLGINAPFGLATKYDANWQGRYQGIESRITTVNISPNIAWKLNKRWSFAIGADIQYMDAKFTNAIDFSAVCLGTASLAANCSAVGLGPTTVQSAATRGDVENRADDWGVGFNTGLLYEFTKDTRFGFHYRSGVKHKLKGDATFSLPSIVGNQTNGVATALQAVFSNTGISSNVALPEQLSFSVYHRMNRLAIMGDITITRWDSLDELRIQFDNPLTPDGVETLNWKNANRYSLGVEYEQSDNWTLRAGIAVDETPIRSGELRTVRLPDATRRWISFGASYKSSDRFSFDFGYAHLFFDDANINRTGSQGDKLVGNFDVDANIVSAQANWKF